MHQTPKWQWTSLIAQLEGPGISVPSKVSCSGAHIIPCGGKEKIWDEVCTFPRNESHAWEEQERKNIHWNKIVEKRLHDRKSPDARTPGAPGDHRLLTGQLNMTCHSIIGPLRAAWWGQTHTNHRLRAVIATRVDYSSVAELPSAATWILYGQPRSYLWSNTFLNS